MPAPQVIIPLIEGTIGSVAGTNQHVALWVKMCKEIMLSASHKDKTDWQFSYDSSVVPAVSAIDATASTLYALLIGTVHSNADGAQFFAVTDVGAGAFNGAAALDNDDQLIISIPAVGTAGVEEFHTYACPEGMPFATGIDVATDGVDAGVPVAGETRCWLLYRS